MYSTSAILTQLFWATWKDLDNNLNLLRNTLYEFGILYSILHCITINFPYSFARMLSQRISIYFNLNSIKEDLINSRS